MRFFILKRLTFGIFCRFVVSGASGAKGRQNKRPGRADQIRALVQLEANQTLFVLVGQMGNSFCEINGVSEKQSSFEYTMCAASHKREKKGPLPACLLSLCL